jgi:hypothetical protein
VQIRIVFQPIAPQGSHSLAEFPILFYGEYFQYSPHHIHVNEDGEHINIPEPGLDMFAVSWHFHSNRERMGDVIQLQDVRQVVQLVPKFGRYADPLLTKDNSMEIGKDYYINNFADKETFHAILSYQ